MDSNSKSFTVIPFTCPQEEAPIGYSASQVVTELWIERCIANHSLFDPDDLVICKPMPGPFPRPRMFPCDNTNVEMKNIAISITGFSGADLLHVERLIALLGADYYCNLTRRRSLLLTPDNVTSGQKLLKAKEWGIPVVRVGWLWEVIRRGGEDIDIALWCDNPVGWSP